MFKLRGRQHHGPLDLLAHHNITVNVKGSFSITILKQTKKKKKKKKKKKNIKNTFKRYSLSKASKEESKGNK